MKTGVLLHPYSQSSKQQEESDRKFGPPPCKQL